MRRGGEASLHGRRKDNIPSIARVSPLRAAREIAAEMMAASAPDGLACCPVPDKEVAGSRVGRCLWKAKSGLCRKVWRGCPVACHVCRRCNASVASEESDLVQRYRKARQERCGADGGAGSLPGIGVVGCAGSCSRGRPVHLTKVPLRVHVRTSDARVVDGSHSYIGTRATLGGGINNMLMGLASLLAISCNAIEQTALLLPLLDADPLAVPYSKAAAAMVHHHAPKRLLQSRRSQGAPPSTSP